MPLYEYQCKKCGHKFEKIQLFSDKPIKKCPECGGAVEKLISRSAVQFKGSGWYATDYAKSGSGGAAKGSDEGGSSAESESSVVRDSKTPAASEGKESKPKAKSESSEKKSSKK